MKSIFQFLALGILLMSSCTPSKTNENKNPQISSTTYPDLLSKALDAHGGVEKWNEYHQLQFTKMNVDSTTEKHIVNLKNRNVLIDRDSARIGFDGSDVWVSPNLGSFGGKSARFYHNLYFYFFGIPFLFTDPGINYEDLGLVMIDSTQYRGLKITYERGVGDSDKDIYIAHFNPENHQLEVLLYTVTYYSDTVTTQFNALVYDEWQLVNGLLVPRSFTGHKFENNHLGDRRYFAAFQEVSFYREAPDQAIFQKPENAEIDSIKAF